MAGFNRIETRNQKQHFHQWNRKSYSLFSILGKSIRIGVLSVIYVLNLAPLKAQTDTIQILRQQDYQLDEVEVRAERTPLAMSEVARLITVISKKEIEASGYQSIQELLNQVSLLDMRQRGPGGIQSDISINGGTYEQVMVLLNGINITDPQTGHFHMDIPVPITAIERIEIISGSAARVLGPNAYGGAINIVTKLANKPELNLNAQAGQHQLRNADIYAGSKFGRMNLSLSSQYGSNAGYIENTDSKNGSVFIAAAYHKGNQTINFQTGINKKAFGANSFYTPLYPEQFEKTGTLFSSLGLLHEGKIKGKQDIYIRYHDDEFHLFRYDSPSWYSGPNNHLSRVIGSHHNFWIDSRAGRSSFGADLRSEKLWSNVLGEALDPDDYRMPDDETTMDFGGYRNHFSIFAEQRYGINGLQISGGILSHLVSGSQAGMHVYPGLDISYRLFPDLKVFSNFSRSLRLPTFTELYYKSPTNQGNIDLLPESSWDYSAGAKYAKNDYSLSSSINMRWSENGIDWVRTNSSEKWETRNISEINSLSFDIRLMLNETMFSNIAEGLSMQLAYHYVDQKMTDSGLESKYLMDYLKHKINYQVRYVIAKQGLVSLNLYAGDRAGDFTDWDDEGLAFQHEYEPYFVTDLNLRWTIRSLTLRMSINNLFNMEYADFGHIRQPGRWVVAGVGFKL